MYLKCNTEKVSETVAAAQALFSGGDMFVESVSMSEASFLGIFGDGKSKASATRLIHGVPVSLDDSAGNFAIIGLSAKDTEETEKTAKKKKK